MKETGAAAQGEGFGARLSRLTDGDALAGLGVVALLSVMLLPLPGGFLDLLIAANLAFALVILLTAVATVRPLDFSMFPSVLLIGTLFRVALNVASSRLVLLHGHEGAAAAGEVIAAFGNFVVGGNSVVGFVLFVILVIVNFVVITKGTERISEVAARFTLDAMPGKQMSIDADLNAGLIDDREARRRRSLISREADFYGTMDGASKFVRGDAIAGVLITVINILGGLAVGVLQNDMPLREALKVYTLLTVGDGLVTQIPALVVSTAAGILVSRAASDSGLGRAFGRQFASQGKPLALAGGMLAALALVPGFPALPLMAVAAVPLGLSWVLSRRGAAPALDDALPEGSAGAPGGEGAAAPSPGSDLPPLLDVLDLELGYGLIPLVDEAHPGGDLLSKIRSIRKQLAADSGIIVPALHVRDNLELKPAEYRLSLKGNPIARSEVMTGHLMALHPGDAAVEIGGLPAKDPAFGLPAVWIPEARREEALRAGFTVIDPATVVATHLTELFKKHADELLSRQTVQRLLEHLAEGNQRLVEDLTPGALPLGTIQKVLQNLLREHVAIRDLLTICETLADQGASVKDPDLLTESVRQALSRAITRPFENPEGHLPVLTLHPEVEDRVARSLQRPGEAAGALSDPEFLSRLVQAVAGEARRVSALGHQPVILCPPLLRRHVRRLLERFLPEVAVISHAELAAPLEIQTLGRIRTDHAG